MISRGFHWFIVVSFCVLLSSCQWLPEVSEVRLSSSSVKLEVGHSWQLTATVLPEAAEYDAITWTSSNPSVVAVSDGRLSALKVGTAQITASTEGVTSSPCEVTVEAIHVTGVSLDRSSITMTEGETETLYATVSPSNATDKSVTWASNNSSVVSVNPSGTISAISPGTTTVVVWSTDGGKTASCQVTVKAKEVPVTGISLNSSSITITEGETSQLTATVSPSNATNKEVTWSSSNTSVATVASDGTVTAKSAGSATITATTASQGKTATCQVTVKAKVISVTGVSISNSTLSLKEGETIQLSATVSPSNATNKAITWSSSSTSIASVSSDGLVTAKKAGTSTITVKTADGGKTATCTVTVSKKDIPVTSVGLTKTSLTLSVGDSSTLTANVYPSDATNKSLTWSSSNTSVATVSSDGVVTGKKAGTATITVTTVDGGKTSTCKITVTSTTVSVTGVSVSPSSLEMKVGETASLDATVYPTNATNQKVSWSSSNTYVATVTSEGTVTAKGTGSATLTCKTSDGGKTATCRVTVVAAQIHVTEVAINKHSVSLAPGETVALKATVYPVDASVPGVQWSSSNKSVATVDIYGVVTAKSAGTAVITVKTVDGGKTDQCTVTVAGSSVAVTGVSLDKSSMSLTVGSSSTLKATVSPSNATNKAVTWSSSNTSVATVSTDGTVTAKAAGTATITAKTSDGGKTATCAVTIQSLIVKKDYIEGGVNYGKGVEIDGTIWAPVNCGYDSNHKYGLLFQWGRRFGQGYNDNSLYNTEMSPSFQEGPVRVTDGESSSNSNTFWYISEVFGFWASDLTDNLWNAGTSSAPVKTINDPCPEGWRVPTGKELDALSKNHSSVITENGIKGIKFSGSKSYDNSIISLFLPLGGALDYQYRIARSRGQTGFYWSTNVYDWNSTMINFDFGVAKDGSSFVNPVLGSSTSGAYGFSVRCVRE